MVTCMQGDHARSHLEGSLFTDVRWVAETESTNSDVLALARAGEPEGLVVVADHQTAGRGRLDRSWQAPAGSSLLVSVLLRPQLAPEHAPVTATAVALAAADACQEVAGVEPSLKWPNDLVLTDPSTGDAGKVGGILAESIVERGQLEAVVVGLGLNVNWPPDPPDELSGIAIALNTVTGSTIDREDLLAALLRHLRSTYGLVRSVAGREELLDAYRSRCATLGQIVRVERAGDVFEGRATGLTAHGHLLVESTGGGPDVEVTVGDVVHLRHA
jgi:BirA family transcriptional regulator, biotin operon repressor / biotin---[acetyl-CoA-carboxylase] ligase